MEPLSKMEIIPIMKIDYERETLTCGCGQCISFDEIIIQGCPCCTNYFFNCTECRVNSPVPSTLAEHEHVFVTGRIFVG